MTTCRGSADSLILTSLGKRQQRKSRCMWTWPIRKKDCPPYPTQHICLSTKECRALVSCYLLLKTAALARTARAFYRTMVSTGYKQSETTQLFDAPHTSNPLFIKNSLTNSCHKVLKICSEENFAWPKHTCMESQATTISHFINRTRTRLEILYRFGRHAGQAMCLSSIHASLRLQTQHIVE